MSGGANWFGRRRARSFSSLEPVLMDDVRRLDLGTFVRPPEETDTEEPRIEAVYGYVVRTATGVLLLDTGLGFADDETEAWYRPRRITLDEALGSVGLELADVSLVVN